MIDLLGIFYGARIVEVRGGCTHCIGDHVSEWRRGGKLVEAVYSDGQRKLICHYCGRAAESWSRDKIIHSDED